MNTNRRHAVAALIAAGLLWGTTVPLSKLALAWLSPGWLTAVRFGLAAASRQASQHGLQFGDVPGDDGEEIVGLAGHDVCRDDLRQGPDQVFEDVLGALVVPGQRGRDVQLQREAGRGRVEPGADHPDDAGLLQPPDPVQGGGRRQARQPGKLDVGTVRVLLQCSEQLYVNIVKFNGHSTKFYLVNSL